MTSMPNVDVSETKFLKMASLNVNSLIKHIDEIQIMLINYPYI